MPKPDLLQTATLEPQILESPFSNLLLTLISGVEIDRDPDAWTSLPEDGFPLIPEYLISGDSIGKI
jgi:hypothetical protein